jgi:aldose 1-epimerase
MSRAPANDRHHAGLLADAGAWTLADGDLEALFLPGLGMLGASLRHRGTELLRRVEDLDAASAQGSTAGIPLLYPWANRLGGFHYRAAGREVELDSRCALLHLDANGLPIHGVPWSLLAWQVTAATHKRLAARLDWTRDELLAIFPFAHAVEMTVSLDADALTIETTVVAAHGDSVPLSFGFHPYFGVPGVPREQWRLNLPAMRRLVLDARQIPTGKEEGFDRMDAVLAGLDLDDGFSLLDEKATLQVSGGGICIRMELLDGYRFAQVYAPKGREFVALEAMTAPTNALSSGRGLRWVGPGGRFSAAFRIRVETI